MAVLKKFGFDLDFAADYKKAEVPRIDLADHDKLVAAARQDGFAQGQATAQQEAMESIERQRVMAFNTIGDAVARAVHALDEVEARIENEALQIALAVATKLAGKLIEREPLDQIKSLVADCLANMRTVPHLVVRVGEAIFEEAEAELSKLGKDKGFAGRLVVMADPSLQIGDARIEWASGGIVIDRAETELRISETIDRFLQAQQGPQEVNHGE